MTVEFEVVTVIDAPLEVAFGLAIDIDAHLGSQAGADERAIGGVRSGRIGPHGHGNHMIDQVRFTAPVGPIGVQAEKAVLGRYLERLIANRGQYLKAEAEYQAAG